MPDNMNYGSAIDDFADEELSDLFSAFDGMGASDALKAKALGAIAAAGAAGAAAAATAVQAPAEQPAGASAASSAQASAGGKVGQGAHVAKAGKAARGPFRALRIASIAACLSVVVVGGVAYGMPTSHVVLSQDAASVEMGVNRFGVVVSASSDNEAGRAIVDAGGLVHAPYEDAFVRVASAMGDPSSINVLVESGDPAQRELLQSGGASLFASLVGEQEPVELKEANGQAAADQPADGAQPAADKQGGAPSAARQLADEPAAAQPSEPAASSGQEESSWQGATKSSGNGKNASESADRRDSGKAADWGSAVSAGEELGNPHANPDAEGVSEYAVSEDPVASGELSQPAIPVGFDEALERSEALYDWSKWSPDVGDPWGKRAPEDPDDSWEWEFDDSWDWGTWGPGEDADSARSPKQPGSSNA